MIFTITNDGLVPLKKKKKEKKVEQKKLNDYGIDNKRDENVIL